MTLCNPSPILEAFFICEKGGYDVSCKRYSKQLIGFAGFSSLLVLWQLAGFLNILPKFVLPTPLEIGNAFVRDRALLIHHSLSYPFKWPLIGLVIGVLLAAGFAILMDSFQWVNDLVYPFMVVIQTIPTIALAPILVLWFGYGMLPKLVLIIITVVFPIVVQSVRWFSALRSRYSEIVSDYASQSLSDLSSL